MNRTKILIIAGMIFIIFILACIKDETVDSDSKSGLINPKLQAIDCLPEQREVVECIEIYQPVCGQLQCAATPCDPETFENSCKACANPQVLSYTKGKCINDEDIKY